MEGRLMQHEVGHLIKLLEEGARMLSPYEVNRKPEERWSVELIRLAKELKSIDNPKTIEEFLQRNYEELFGVKDTFRELWIDPENNHVAQNFSKANKQLDSFRHSLYGAWHACKRENRHL